jgi:hypothetical protein
MFILLNVASGPVKYEYCTCVYPPGQVGTKLKLSSEKDQSFKRAFSGKVGGKFILHSLPPYCQLFNTCLIL